MVDLATGRELNLARPNTVDAVPEWSSDGRLLIFWSVVRDNLKESGLWTMNPDGSGRRRIPLPHDSTPCRPLFRARDRSRQPDRVLGSTKSEP